MWFTWTPSSGARALLNLLVGKLYAPNLSQPNWFVEGLAVLMESRQTTAAACAAASSTCSCACPSWRGGCSASTPSRTARSLPAGHGAYLYGSSLLTYFEDRYGPDKSRRSRTAMAAELIPGGMNRVRARRWKRVRRGLGGLEAVGSAAATRCEAEEAHAPRADPDHAPDL